MEQTGGCTDLYIRQHVQFNATYMASSERHSPLKPGLLPWSIEEKMMKSVFSEAAEQAWKTWEVGDVIRIGNSPKGTITGPYLVDSNGKARQIGWRVREEETGHDVPILAPLLKHTVLVQAGKNLSA